MTEWILSSEGVKIYQEAGLSENTFYRHARENKIRKIPSEERERGALYNFYDIKRLTDYQKLKRKKRLVATQSSDEEGRTDWFNEHDLPYLLALDYETYGIEESLDLSISHSWWLRNPYLCRVLYNAKDRKDIWGYATLIPMKEELIFKLLRREMHERDIKPEHILIYEKGQEYTIYAASVVIKAAHRNSLRGLIKSIFAYWCEQYPSIKMSKIYAYADSKEGWYLIKHLFFAPRYDIGKGAFELDLRQINPSKTIKAFQDCLKERPA
ncbi:MAG TPA: hypothetical protein VKY19_28075 [Ktedonosporobacter sp.]|jgi:hypothetical protein|nr:hypothetical protein [Ktedonosporobacter sp.]